jgi:hypothetical protein
MSSSNAHHRKPPAHWLFVFLGLALFLLFCGGTLWLTGWTAGNAEPEEAARAALRIKTLADLRADNAKKLGEYAWVDRAKGSVQIPIQRAMERVLPELNASRPHAAYPIIVPVAPPATPTP